MDCNRKASLNVVRQDLASGQTEKCNKIIITVHHPPEAATVVLYYSIATLLTGSYATRFFLWGKLIEDIYRDRSTRPDYIKQKIITSCAAVSNETMYRSGGTSF